MHLQRCAITSFGLACLLSGALAGSEGRGSNPGGTIPTVCNNLPDAGSDTVASAPDVRKRTSGRADAKGESLTSQTRNLTRRAGTVSYDPNCNAAPPAGSKYGSGFPTMQSILEKAYSDAHDLANEASVIEFDSPA